MTPPSPSNLKELYKRLYRYYGPQLWWPAQSRFEVIVGAVLTQNTNWGNVVKAIENLRQAKKLTLSAVHRLDMQQLADYIRPSGYFNIKAGRLKNVVSYIVQSYRGDLAMMSKEPLGKLRTELLSVNGVGPETADSILLYAFDKPTFVVDAYTRRLMYRHGWADHDMDYHTLQKIFTDRLPAQVRVWNEYHALVVRVAKDFCRTKPLCDTCPLNSFHYSISKRCKHCHRVKTDARHHACPQKIKN